METRDEYADEYANKNYSTELGYPEEDYYISFLSFVAGAKWNQSRSYSEQDMKYAYEQGARLALISQSPLALRKGEFPTPQEWINEFNK
jgi:hypothetical protein